jgi:hypothetical protein
VLARRCQLSEIRGCKMAGAGKLAPAVSC